MNDWKTTYGLRFKQLARVTPYILIGLCMWFVFHAAVLS